MAAAGSSGEPDYEVEKERCKAFLTGFRDPYAAEDDEPKYLVQLVSRPPAQHGRSCAQSGPQSRAERRWSALSGSGGVPATTACAHASSLRTATDREQADACTRRVPGRPGRGTPASSLPGARALLPLTRAAQFEGEGDLASAVNSNTRRYMQLFSEAADEVLPLPTELHEDDDVFDVLMRQVRRCALLPHPLASHSRLAVAYACSARLRRLKRPARRRTRWGDRLANQTLASACRPCCAAATASSSSRAPSTT